MITVAISIVAGCASDPALPADDVATYQKVTGSDGQEFLQEISTHGWADQGLAAAEIFAWVSRDAGSADRVVAQKAGQTGHAIATFLANEQSALSDVKAGWFGLERRTVGELNPKLVAAFATALTPFQGALVGDEAGVTGFPIIGDPLNLASARSIFSVIDTSSEAGEAFNTAAYQRVRNYLQTYAEAVARNDSDGFVALRFAAGLAGVVEGGRRMAENETVNAPSAQYFINWAGYEIARAMGAAPDGIDIAQKFFTADGRLKSPDDVAPSDLSVYSTALQNFAFSHGLPNLGNEFQEWYDTGVGK